MENEVNTVKTEFSKRERQVADLLSRGYSEKEVADILRVSPDTINKHTKNIREKFGLHKNSEIILKYISERNNKPFNIKNIREYGIGIILVLLNICEFNKGI